MIDIKKYEKAIKKSGYKIKDIDYIKQEIYTDFLLLHKSKQEEVRRAPLCSSLEIYFNDGACLRFPIFTDFYY